MSAEILDLTFSDIETTDQLTSLTSTTIKNSKAIKLSYNQLSNISDLSATFLKLCLNNLSWIDLSFNKITVIPESITEMKTLQVLYLHSNQLSDIRQLSRLKPLTQLRSLTLQGNPLETGHKQGRKGYRLQVMEKLPHLKSLDFCGVSPADHVVHQFHLRSSSASASGKNSNNSE